MRRKVVAYLLCGKPLGCNDWYFCRFYGVSCLGQHIARLPVTGGLELREAAREPRSSAWEPRDTAWSLGQNKATASQPVSVNLGFVNPH